MGRTCGFAWSCTTLMGVDPVIITIIEIPFILTPFCCIRQFLSWILDFFSFFVTKLLSESGCSGRAVLYTSSAGYALFLVNVCNICGT